MTNDSPNSPAGPSLGQRLLKLDVKTALGGLLLLLVLVLGVRWVYQTFLMSDEDKIRALLENVQRTTAERNPAGTVGCLTEDFKAGGGRWRADKADVRSALQYVFLAQYKAGFELTIKPETVDVKVAADGNTAHATITMSARGKPDKAADWKKISYPEFPSPVRVKLEFKKTDDGWKISKATHAKGGDDDDE